MNGYPCTVIGSTFDEAFTVLWKLPGQMKAHVLIRESLVSQHLFLPNRDTLRKSSSHITAPSPSFAWDKPHPQTAQHPFLCPKRAGTRLSIQHPSGIHFQREV